MRESTVAVSLVVDIVAHLARRGVDRDKLCAETGISPASLSQADARIPGSQVERLWEVAERLTGDADLGLHTAETYNPGALDIVGYVLLSCHTAAQAIDRLSRYAALLNDGLRVTVERSGLQTILRCEPIDSFDNYLLRSPRQAVEGMAAGIVLTVNRLASLPVSPVSVAFRHGRPASDAEHRRIFGPVVCFAAGANEVTYSTADLDTPFISANEALLTSFERHADALVERLQRDGPTSRRVLKELGSRMKGTVPTLEEVAGTLSMSGRSLQRTLQQEGTTFLRLVDQLQHELAVSYLADSTQSTAQVAFLLGFSEQSAFSRAFKRWTGRSPAAFRSH